MVEIRKLRAGYGEREVLRGIDLHLEPGLVTVLMGPNGCGKTTLLKTILGMVPASQGQILLDGVDLRTLPLQGLARKIAYLPQSKQTPDINVGRMVLHGRFSHLSFPRTYQAEDRRIAEAAMREMGISHLAEMPLAELSGGQRQKAYIAMALAQESPVILMDEPTTYLDASQQFLFADTVHRLAEAGKTVVLVLHDLLYCLKIADRVALMADGRVQASGTVEDVLKTGCISQIYGIEIGSVETEKGKQFYYNI